MKEKEWEELKAIYKTSGDTVVLKLIAEVERLKAIEQHAIMRIESELASNRKLAEENMDYKQALEFYADDNVYHERQLNDMRGVYSRSPVAIDKGDMAKKVLIKHNERYCNKCTKKVVKSDLEEYVFQCNECDEDLYAFETHTQPQKQ